MQVSVEKKQGLERVMKVTLDASEVDNAVSQRLTEITPNVKMQGFRTGKVPAQVVKKQYGESVRFEVLQKLLQDTLPKAFEQEKVNPAGMPNIDFENNKEGEPLTYVATFEVYPEFDVKDLVGTEVEQFTTELTDADFDDAIDEIRAMHTEWAETDGPVKKDFRITMDFTGSIDGEEFEGGKAENYTLEMGKGRFIEDFEKGVVGMKAGDEQDIDVMFPKDYHEEKFAGKKAVFKIKLHKVEEGKLPELNDEFAKKLDVKDGGVEALKKDIKSKLEKQLRNTLEVKNKAALFDKLIELNPLEIPRAAIQEDIKQLKTEFLQRQLQQQEVDPKFLDMLPDDRFEDDAKRRIHLQLLVSKLSESKELKVDQAIVEELIKETVEDYHDAEQLEQYIRNNEQQKRIFENNAFEKQVVNLLVDQIKAKPKKVSFKELMGRN